MSAQELGLLPWPSEIKGLPQGSLHRLACSGNISAFQKALERAAPGAVNETDRAGRTPLHIAVASGFNEAVQTLISITYPTRVDTYSRDKCGRAPLHYAACLGDLALAEILIGDAPAEKLDIVDIKEDTPAIIAAGAGHSCILRSLLLGHASVNQRNDSGMSPLHKAAVVGEQECVSMLLQARAAVNARDVLNRKPLHWALIYKYEAIAGMLREGKNVVLPPTYFVDPMAPTTKTRTAPSAPSTAGSWSKTATRRSRSSQPQGRDAEREALLEGQGPRAKHWTGTAGSLTVRWRGWAKATFAEAGLVQTATAAEGGPPRQSLVTIETDGAVPDREQVGEICKDVGGFFCTACWEHVTEDHPVD